ncbi:unnamed protein product [Arctia plantaginis]|uniref:Glucose-methanol-choline oxidoreductase N-terminal domain-containing protein n=1 Tax=Arctia plantaginis TaxID=874455 RepID=A0A8S0YMQ0_ARCPL|nr:unnamed protein product [Arctia plantaginis]
MSWACDQALTANIVESYQVAGPLFVNALQSFLVAQCALVGDHLWPDDATQAVLNDPNYDFIVVGAGSAGSVVANRLSENPEWKVLLVEAGGNPTLSTENPHLFYNNMGTSLDWGYKTEPQDGACGGYKDKRCAWPRGKVLGGCSSINAMFYVRANKADYDQWAAEGNYGWSYDDVLPYFLKSENFHGHITEENKIYHSQNGPLHVQQENKPHPFENMILEAASELGLNNVSDINGASQMGVLVSHYTTKDNYRFSTARAFLSPAKSRKNLHVMKHAYVTQVLFKSGSNRVSGVLINKDGKNIIVNAKKEVILSGGSINSPQLLMLSGLGPKKHLEEKGIDVKADLAVGENLQDHVFAPLFYTMPGDKEITSLPNIAATLMKYILEGTGPVKDLSPHRVIAFINTTDPLSSLPDIQFHYLVTPPGLSNMLDIFGKHGFNDDIHKKYLKMNEDKFIMLIYAVLLQPMSKGKILLESKNPFDKPLIDPNYLKNPEDVASIIRACKQHIMKLGDTNSFQKTGFKLEWLDLDACKEFNTASDEHLECTIRQLTFSLYHPTSTVKMGPKDDPTAVVDPELRVYKVKGLRVVDASIMPNICVSNIISEMSWACDQALTSNIVNSYQTAGPLFIQTLQSFLAAQCALVGDHLWPDDATKAVLDDPNYDFIVVGAGSAGSVVANRLSENPEWKVLLVEAGGNPNIATEIPQLFFSNMGTSVDWDYHSQPQEGACRGYKKKGCAWPRGKLLGGSSSINGMFYVRGNRADYDEWAASGNNGWSYEDVLPYFLKIENFNGDVTHENEKYHNQNGPLNVVQGKPNPLENLIIQAAVELGIKNVTDINGDNQMGILVSHTNIKNNFRVSTARAYLSPIKERKNLHVMKHTYATQILFIPGTNTVSGILVNKYGKDITVNAKKEIILSGGSVNSPQLLMLSGIGPKKYLEDVGVTVIADLPVGENLQDHIFAPIFYSMPFDKDTTTLANIFGAFVKYILEGSGPLKNTSPNRVISFINTTDAKSSSPDIQFHYLFLPPDASNITDVYGKHGLGEEFHQKFLKMNEDKLFIAAYSVVLYPKSKGKILLASKNPFEKPLIYADYFKDPEDLACMVRAMKQHSLKLGDTKTFKSAGLNLDWVELDACKDIEKASDEYLECIARELTFSLYHPTSTVKMGPENDVTSVVDPELKVRKVNGLRVIDASIMPNIVRGNTNAASMMIGEKGADMIKHSWLNKEHTEL